MRGQTINSPAFEFDTKTYTDLIMSGNTLQSDCHLLPALKRNLVRKKFEEHRVVEKVATW
jgi:hypothetical protein